jgi:hypothetical protein
MDTTLFGDLGVDGADGPELIQAFAKEFGLDISTFDACRHFGPEAGFSLLHSIVQFFRMEVLREDVHGAADKLPIAIRDLVAAAEAKRWPKDRGEAKRRSPTSAGTDWDVV